MADDDKQQPIVSHRLTSSRIVLAWCNIRAVRRGGALALRLPLRSFLLLPNKHIRCPAGQAHYDGCEDGGAEAVDLE